jgi:hypothetical protein
MPLDLHFSDRHAFRNQFVGIAARTRLRLRYFAQASAISRSPHAQPPIGNCDSQLATDAYTTN